MANKRFRKSLTFTTTRLVNLLNLVCMPQIASRHVKFGDEGAIHLHGATQRTSLAKVFPCRAFQQSKSSQEVFHTASTMGAGLAMIRDVIVPKKTAGNEQHEFLMFLFPAAPAQSLEQKDSEPDWSQHRDQ